MIPYNIKWYDSTSDPSLEALYTEHLHQNNPLMKSLASAKAGDIHQRIHYLSDKVFMKTEIYFHLFKPQDIFHIIYPIIFKDETSVAGMTFTRPHSLPDFDKEEIRLINLLLPHLQRAFRLYGKIAGLETENSLMTEALDKLPQGVVIVDESGKIGFVNRSAKEIFALKDGLTLDKSGKLTAAKNSETIRLRNLIKGVFQPGLAAQPSHGGVMNISRPSELRPFSVLIAPISKPALQQEINLDSAALMFISDPEQKTETVEQMFCQLYYLTPAEARLAAILAQGKSLNEAGEELKVKQNTVRTHLKRIFSKTATRRQSDLIKLLLNSPATLK